MSIYCRSGLRSGFRSRDLECANTESRRSEGLRKIGFEDKAAKT